MQAKVITPIIPTETEAENPIDTVSCIDWVPITHSAYIFASASWDNKISFYELKEGPFLSRMECIDAPATIVSLSWKNNLDKLFLGGMDSKVYLYDLEKERFQVVVDHKDPLVKVCWIESLNSLVSFSIDGEVKLWDSRMCETAGQTRLPGRLHAVDIQQENDNKFIAGLENKLVQYTLLKDALLGKKGSFLSVTVKLADMAQFTSFSISPNGTLAIAGVTDGNIVQFYIKTLIKTIEFSITDVMSIENDTFMVSNVEYFPNISGLFYYTGRKIEIVEQRVFSSNRTIISPSPITTSKLSPDGKYLAFATGDDWSQGLFSKNKYTNEIFLYSIEDMENQIKQDNVVLGH